MHWTGMRPSQMGRLRAEDFRFDEPIPYVAVPRGKGGRIAAVPLVPEGVAAARAFLAAEAFGPWPRSSVNRALARAARKAGRPAFTTYQIRHSFAAGLRRAGTDVADIQDLYGHTRPETTMIYAPPELAKHRAALERLRRDDGSSAPNPGSRPVLAGTTRWQADRVGL
jgi:integrase